MSFTARIRLDADRELARIAANKGVAKQVLLSNLIMRCEGLQFELDEDRVATSFILDDATETRLKALSNATGVPQTRIIDYLVEKMEE